MNATATFLDGFLGRRGTLAVLLMALAGLVAVTLFAALVGCEREDD